MAKNWNIWGTFSAAQKAEHGPRIAAVMPNTDTIDDPDWNGEGQAPQVPKYANGEWIDELVLRHLKDLSRKGQVVINQNNATVTNPLE